MGDIKSKCDDHETSSSLSDYICDDDDLYYGSRGGSPKITANQKLDSKTSEEIKLDPRLTIEPKTSPQIIVEPKPTLQFTDESKPTTKDTEEPTHKHIIFEEPKCESQLFPSNQPTADLKTVKRKANQPIDNSIFQKQTYNDKIVVGSNNIDCAPAKIVNVPKGYVFGACSKKLNIPQPLNVINISKPEKIDVSKLTKFESTGKSMFDFIGGGPAPILDTVETNDGEEQDTHVVNTSAKMYTFDKSTKLWKGGMMVTVHLNDCVDENGEGYSRIVVRVCETHKLVVNSKVTKNTLTDEARENRLQLMVNELESGEPKIICLKTGKAEELYNCIVERIN